MTSTEVTDKKESLNLIDISKVDGMNLLQNEADAIQQDCKDYVVQDISLRNLAVYCEGHKTKVAKFTAQNDSGNCDVLNRTFTEHSFGQMCGKIGVPVKYIDKCITTGYDSLAQENLNTWVNNYNKDLLLRVYKDKIRGVLSNKYGILDSPDILQVIDTATRGLGLKVKGYYLSEERFHARLIQQETMKINGEDLFAGIQIDSSDVGRSALNVNFFIYKQVCTNGLAIAKGKGNMFKQKHFNICTEDFREQLSLSLKSLPELITEYEHIIRQSAIQYNLFGTAYCSISQEDYDKSIKNFIDKIRLKTGLSEEGAKKVSDLSMNKYGTHDWGVINSLTEVAQDYTLERRIALERIAGDFLSNAV